MSGTILDEPTQATMFDTTGREFNAFWVDEKQALFIPNQPLHFKAHKLQVLMDVLLRQAQKMPGQFSAKNYFDTVNEYTNCVEAIRHGETTVHDKGNVVEDRDDTPAPEVGDPTLAGVDIGISADNPFAR